MTYRRISQEEAWRILPENEREGLERLVEMVPEADRDKARTAAKAVALERCRRARKAILNARRDQEMRVLVGARVPRAEYLAIREAAYRQGTSMYQFIRDTLRRAARR